MFHVITHCYSPPGMEFYADSLLLQLRSIISAASATRHQVTIWVVRTTKDRATADAVLSSRGYEAGGGGWANIIDWPVEPPEMFRRAIMRERILFGLRKDMRQTSAIWLADCDYIVEPGFFESAEAAVAVYPAVYPRKYHIARTHRLGDSLIEAWTKEGFPSKMPSHLFHDEYPPRAIGGMMFLAGAMCTAGYVQSHSRWLKPTHWTRFESFGDDIVHRRHLEALGKPYRPGEVHGLYRLRHTRAGYKKSDIEAIQ